MTWYRDVFRSKAWQHVHAGFWQGRDPKTDATTIEALLGLKPSSRILDVPCGTGRISVALAQQGHTVSGLDLSKPLLDEARCHAQVSGVSIDWTEGDKRLLIKHYGAAVFDAAVCWWGSFGYLENDGDQQFLTEVAATLRDGGSLLIDTFIAEGLLPVFAPSGVWSAGDTWIAEERRYDLETGRIHSTWTVRHDGEYDQFETHIRLYTWREIKAILLAAGFRTVVHLNGEGLPFVVSGRGARSRIVATK